MYHKKLDSFTQVEKLDIYVVDVTTSIFFYGILKHAIMLQKINHYMANGSARSHFALLYPLPTRNNHLTYIQMD